MGVEIEGGSADRQCPWWPVQPDNFMETLLYLLYQLAGMAPMIPLDGEDKPPKYPTIFNSADVAVITKTDLAIAVEFDWKTACGNIQAVRPGLGIFRVSAKSGEGLPEWRAFLENQGDRTRE